MFSLCRLRWDILQIAEKVKLFFFEYARNRHKMTTLTPSYHAVSSELFSTSLLWLTGLSGTI